MTLKTSLHKNLSAETFCVVFDNFLVARTCHRARLCVTAFSIEEIRIKRTPNPVSRASSRKKQFQRNRSRDGREGDFALEWPGLVSLFGAQRARE